MTTHSTALKTDAYELTMLDAWVREGRQDDPATFEVFSRRLTPGHRYGVVAGTERALDAIQNFEFYTRQLAYVRDALGLSDETIEFLHQYRFTGTVRGYREGDLYFPNSPILQVEGRLADVMLETVILSILNHDSAIAGKAARIVQEAHGKPVVEMGSRRTHDDSAVAAARAAYVAGFAATSNLEAGLRYGIPVKGTAAHAFTLSYMPGGGVEGDGNTLARRNDAELAAFEAQVAAQGAKTTLLVDTFDVEQGVRNAVKAAGTSLGAIRIDSGDLALEATRARKLLDSLGAFGTRILVTSDLDEHVIKDLRVAGAPIDGYGVGTKLVSTPPAGMVYKLVEVNGVPVAKAAKDKVSLGGRKHAYRLYDEDGRVCGEVLTTAPELGVNERRARPLLHTFVERGERTEAGRADCHAAANVHRDAMEELPENERHVWSGDHGPFLTAELA